MYTVYTEVFQRPWPGPVRSRDRPSRDLQAAYTRSLTVVVYIPVTCHRLLFRKEATNEYELERDNGRTKSELLSSYTYILYMLTLGLNYRKFCNWSFQEEFQ